MESLQGMTLMLHKRELKSKGQNPVGGRKCRFKVKGRRNHLAFPFTA
jgi:hypothetical protein